MQENRNIYAEKGNAVAIVLVVLVVIAVGALAYLAGQRAGENRGGADSATSQAQQAAVADQQGDEQNRNQIDIEPGNPVVATVNGEEITRLEVFQFIQNLPQETRQLPLQNLFPVALNQVINARVVNEKVEDVDLPDDPEVERQLEQAREQIVRNVYIQNQVSERITDERLQQLYQQYSENFPEVMEARAAHILVEDRSTAQDILSQLQEGADFAELAQEFSIDATADQGGQLNYFTQTDVVPEFGEAVFSAEIGEVIDEPVESEFGYHIIKVQERRIRPVPPFEEARPFLEAQLRRAVLDQVIAEWRQEADVTRFDINGNPVELSAQNAGSEPSAEGEEAAETPAE